MYQFQLEPHDQALMFTSTFTKRVEGFIVQSQMELVRLGPPLRAELVAHIRELYQRGILSDPQTNRNAERASERLLLEYNPAEKMLTVDVQGVLKELGLPAPKPTGCRVKAPNIVEEPKLPAGRFVDVEDE